VKYQNIFIYGILLFILLLIPLDVFSNTSGDVAKFEIGKVIIPVGITTYVSLLVTIIAGIRRWKLKYHRLLAILTIIFASIHATIVILTH